MTPTGTTPSTSTTSTGAATSTSTATSTSAANRRPAAGQAVRTSARDRILDTADRLFYAEGIQTVGIDRIIDTAGVAKASLYKNFGSKDALIAAYLQRRGDSILGRLVRAADAETDPRAKVLAVFDSQATTFTRSGYRGCAFAAASAEATAGDGVDTATTEFRATIRSLFLELATGLGVSQPDVLARQLQLLYDGASLSARSDRDPSIGADARAAAAALVDAALTA